MFSVFNEITIDESIDDARKKTLGFLRNLSNTKVLPPMLRSQVANEARNLSKDVFGTHKNSAKKFHCEKCNVILNSDMVKVKIAKRNKKKICEMTCKGCGSVFYFDFNARPKNGKCSEIKMEAKKDIKNTTLVLPKPQLVVKTKPKVNNVKPIVSNVKPKKKLTKLQMMLQQQAEADNSSNLSTFFDSFSL
uniref:RNAse P Rpr2/Rpp21/SNM1 subunit domain-containing protein n=1 Tax=Strongyloides papillosus TaxID=174720 RepID=A0A0N5BBR3_STREA